MTASGDRRTTRRPSEAPCRAHVIFVGRVQGVGFRYTAERFALDLKLTGWVKNLRDGSVEMVCEGPKATVERLLEEIQGSALGPLIKKTRCRWLPPTGEFDDFCVEFCL